VSGESNTILEVQDAALIKLGALADKVDGKSKTGELKRATQQVERDVAIQLAILARCFELHDQFRVVELDHVLATAPQKLEGHRLGLAEARQKRRAAVLERTGRVMERMDAAGAIVNANIILHARAARSVISSLNATGAAVDDFHALLGIKTGRDVLSTQRWREAPRPSAAEEGRGRGRSKGRDGGRHSSSPCCRGRRRQEHPQEGRLSERPR
jgi:hypothetical protein